MYFFLNPEVTTLELWPRRARQLIHDKGLSIKYLTLYFHGIHVMINKDNYSPHRFKKSPYLSLKRCVKKKS